MIIAVVIVLALFAPLVLVAMDVVTIPVAIVAAIGIVLLAGWGIDRHRRPGARDPFLDANRSDFAVPLSGKPPYVIPTEAVESPRDRRVPD